MSSIVRVAWLACLLAAGPAGLTSAFAAAHSRTNLAADAGSGAGGEEGDNYSWSPERAPSGPVEVVVSLSEQRVYVYRDGVQIGESEASTGKEDHETPTGVFPILEKERFHRSSKYNDAPMPFMQRLTDYGVALHAGPLPGYAASHGCIRLPAAFARKLFGVTSVGTTVVVTDGPADAARGRDTLDPGVDGAQRETDLDSPPSPDDPSP
jgi:hypothetical protein